MATILTLTQKRPEQRQFGLDTFTEIYKCDATADVVLTDPTVPQMGSAHADFPFMFVTGRPCYETGQSASELNLIYMGCLNTLDGGPVLPSAQNTVARAIQSSTTHTDAITWPAATTGLTIQYYCPTNSVVVMSTSSTSSEVCPDPPAITTADLLTFDFGAELPAGSFPAYLDFIIASAFVQVIVETTDAQEVVDGQYWQVTKRKTMQMFPYAPPS